MGKTKEKEKWHNIAKNFDILIRFIKYFQNACFTGQVLVLLLIFPGKSVLGGMKPWTFVHLLWIHSLTWLEKFKQIFLKF